jgi:EpsD family peptidyl-prolyl cis-trans isomerase
VAAKVGSEEISVHQINQVLGRSNAAGASPEALQGMSREVLEKLIDEQLAVEEATQAKLHRAPEVVAQIEAAKREILARAYLQQLTSSLPKPTEAETRAYFAANPQLFAERRAFNLQEIVAKPVPGLADMLTAMGNAGKPLSDIAAVLKEKNIPFNGGNATRNSEQIPLDLLPKLYAVKDGQSVVRDSPQNVTLLRVVSSVPAPVTEATALPSIERFLANQRASDAVTARLKELRASAKISYMGEFSAPPATAATPNSAQPASVMEKGVAGLK